MLNHHLKVVPDLIEASEVEKSISSTVTPAVATEFVKECQKAINEIAAKHGMTLQQYEVGHTAFDVSVNLLAAPLSTIQFDLHMQNYIAHGTQFGLRPEWIQRTIVGLKDGEKFEAKICGLVIIKNVAQVRLATNNGIKYLTPNVVVKMMDDVNTKAPTSTLGLQLAHAEVSRKTLVEKLFRQKSLERHENN